MWHVYICDRNGKLYTGITTDLEHRMRQHGARLLYSEPHPDRFLAAKRENQIKGVAQGQEDGPYRQSELALSEAEGSLSRELMLEPNHNRLGFFYSRCGTSISAIATESSTRASPRTWNTV